MTEKTLTVYAESKSRNRCKGRGRVQAADLREADSVTDQYLGTCVICGRPADGDFCNECVEAGQVDDAFGRCYQCRDFLDHESCIGVPCQCPCPPPNERRKNELREQALSKLTPQEREALGV